MDTPPSKPAIDPEIRGLTTNDELAEYLRRKRAELDQAVRDGVPGLATALAYSDVNDTVLRRMFELACERAGRSASPDTVPIAVVATGGYGRREVCPHSDIDITFIPQRDGDPLLDRVIKEMFTLLMRVFIDANGMEVGYAYRLLDDNGSLDHQTMSGLLDARLVTGSDRIFIQFENDFWLQFNPAEFIFTKVEERAAQVRKMQAVPRVVEPNIKEGAGGMRELHTAVWVTQAARTLTAARVRGSRVWEGLTRHGGATAKEADQLAAAKEFMFRVRNALHVVTGAERDQLVVTRQEEVAALLGYHSDESDPSAPPAVEKFMRDFYRHTDIIHRLSDDITRRAWNGRLFLGIGLDCLARQVIPAGPALAAEDPLWMLWACELAQRYDLELSDQLVRVIVDLLETRPVIKDRREAAQVLNRILASERGAYPMLQRMADLGILGWLVPELGQIIDLIPYDPSHDYTVGQHTLYVVRALDRLRLPDTDEETRDFRQLIHEIPRPEELYMAALLHDAGKAFHGRPHSVSGAEIAEQVCRSLHWDEASTANVAFLVRQHLLMAEVSRLRDLTVDETIRDFTALVDDIDRLHMLYLLTYADTKAVGSGIWTQVKGRFLRDLHRRAARQLAGEESEEFDDAGLARTRRRLMRELSVENLPDEEVAQHVESMPPNYLLNSTLNEIALHIGFVRTARAGQPTIDFHDERNATFSEVTVCAPDDPKPGLLAKITGVFFAADVSVHSAQIFTRVAGEEQIAIDSFYVDFRGRQLTPGKRKEIATHMTAVLKGETTVAQLLAKRRKPTALSLEVERTTVRFDLADNYTVIEVVAHDATGVFYRASAAVSSLGWDIHSARVSLFKGRGVVSFYVTGARELGEENARRQLERALAGTP